VCAQGGRAGYVNQHPRKTLGCDLLRVDFGPVCKYCRPTEPAAFITWIPCRAGSSSRSKFRLRGSLSGQSVAPPSCPQQVRPNIFPNLATPANLAERCISCSGICRDGTNRAAGFPVIQCRECDDASSVSIVASRSAAPPPLFTLSRRRPRVRVPSSAHSCQKLTQLHRIRGTSNNRHRFLHIVTGNL